MFMHRSTWLLAAVVVVGAATFAWARVPATDARLIPYQGVLERDGVPVSGPVTARFGLFNSAASNTACVLTNSCPLWSEEQTLDVVDGRFSVLLGDSGSARTLTSAILAAPELFLAVAFQTADDGAFSLLGGTQQIVGAPMIQPGTVTATSFAPGTLFSANIGFSFETGEYFATSASPPGWIGSSEFDTDGPVFGLNTFGAARLRCTASPVNFFPTLVVIKEANPGTLRIGTYNIGGGYSPTDFTVICHGF